jgi:hypothetical protein
MWPWETVLHASDPGLPLTPGLAMSVLGVSFLVLLVIAYVFYVDCRGAFA